MNSDRNRQQHSLACRRGNRCNRFLPKTMRREDCRRRSSAFGTMLFCALTASKRSPRRPLQILQPLHESSQFFGRNSSIRRFYWGSQDDTYELVKRQRTGPFFY